MSLATTPRAKRPDQFTRMVRADGRFDNTRVLLLTSAANLDEEELTRAGVDRVLPKPVLPSDLFNALTTLHARPEAPGLEAAPPEGVARGKLLRAQVPDALTLRDVAAAVAEARRQLGTPSARVGIVGYCWGGTLAWLAACELPGVDAAVGYYGSGVAGYAGLQPQAPVMLHFGLRDAGIPSSDVEKTRAAHPAVPVYQQQMKDFGENRWQVVPVLETLKAKARAEGLWNLFLPPSAEHDDGPYRGAGLTNLEYALCAEEMGKVGFGSEVFNCSAPDTGNMEVLHRYGSREQKDRWLEPLMAGEIRSAFLMTEPAVASSDATTMQATAVIDGDEVVLNGVKWWSTGVGHVDCRIFIVMGLTDPTAPRHAQHSMVLVPRDTPGVRIVRLLPTMGYHDEPFGHGEVALDVGAERNIGAGETTLAIRPEAIRLTPGGEPRGEGFAGTVTHRIFLGSSVEYSVSVPALGDFLVTADRSTDEGQLVEPGQSVRLGFDPAAAHLFPASHAAQPEGNKHGQQT